MKERRNELMDWRCVCFSLVGLWSSSLDMCVAACRLHVVPGVMGKEGQGYEGIRQATDINVDVWVGEPPLICGADSPLQ